VVQVSGGTQTTSYTYDSWGRLTTIDYPTSDDVSYTYDAENRRLSMTDGIGTQAYEYDAWGRVTRKTNCCGGDITSSYDPAGRRLTLTDPDEREITYDYDALGRLVWAEDTRGRISFVYDSAGRLEKQVYPNEYAWVYAYDPGTGELISKEYRDPEEQVEQAWKYTYDVLHRLIESAESPSGDVVSITYDDANRTIFEERTGSQGYLRASTYLPDGAIDSETIDSSAASRWYVYGYDTAGRMLTTTDLIQGTTSTYGWDAHQLTRWDSDDRTYARIFTYDEESRITKIERLMYDTQQLSPGLEYQYTGDGHRHSMKDHPRSYESREACGSLVVWYRENGSNWQPAVQSYGIQGCITCTSNPLSENRRAWYDAYWLPNTYEPETPALCAVACLCAGVCLYALIRPCLDQCQGTENLFDCLKTCLSDRLADASLPVKLVCGGCVLGCAFCLIRVIFPPRAPSTPPPPAPHPVEPPHEDPHRPVPNPPPGRVLPAPPKAPPIEPPSDDGDGHDDEEYKLPYWFCLQICNENIPIDSDPGVFALCMYSCLYEATPTPPPYSVGIGRRIPLLPWLWIKK
jgi:YD repeat-containing protein